MLKETPRPDGSPEAAARVPFNRAYTAGRETAYMAAAVRSGSTAGDGPFTRRAAAHVAALTGAPRALLTTSCTHALELTALLLDLRPGDEVIMPAFTFTSTANAYVLRGAVPVFVDVRPDTLNIDERLIEDAVTERTRAIVVVHYAGVACEMDAVLDVAGRYGIPVVEDNAHGLGGSYRGRPLGSLGVLGAQSFHMTKNVQCGEGGALVINDERFAERAEILREKGTDRGRFFRGEVDKYHWQDTGSSYLLSDVLAAFLLAQLEAFTDIQAGRERVWAAYHERLAAWAAANGVRRPTVPEGAAHPAHLYYLLPPGRAGGDALIEHLSRHGVQAVSHYRPLHDAPAGVRYGRVAPGGCPVTERVAAGMVRLPLFAGMTEREVDRVVDAVVRHRARRPRRR
ncbi:dTDP-4-amino-4,6-dideoxygalactose transaminase [Actinomadura algeriensis]|uniref:dTDP-4-amino-4,6-dideoxygalactose transaminase n=1 Tax=Actinomadura algeriensis TaxID=1679523 RepID=A0ABR9JJ69_9ACTN|nr:dTDP-4-amino-4,6-dideoxygalactose transaminase [Actinomadura algeriensis]MBE1530504.1 dTDP-4-amino-4,6-dideoxygalactose transaminase [Actinomadura algeriensis]